MTGIYMITNLITGERYIGQSLDIERRFMEHKTPKAKKYRIDRDINEYGAKNFQFVVLEECGKSELTERERHYIDTLAPEYNTVVKGKRRSEDFCEKVRSGTKRWWQNLPEETKQKIITKNLKRPPKGHHVSEQTREKLRNCYHRTKKVMIVETKETFNSIKELEAKLGCSTGTYAAYRSGKIKSVKGYQVIEV